MVDPNGGALVDHGSTEQRNLYVRDVNPPGFEAPGLDPQPYVIASRLLLVSALMFCVVSVIYI